jgi:chaperonin GroEL (HSP60 family)
LEIIDDNAIPVEMDDRATHKKVAITSMGSKAVGPAKEHLADIAIDAVKQIVENAETKQ